MAEAVTRDMASFDWLKLAALCLFHAQSVSKNKSICDCAGARPQSDRSTPLSNSLLPEPPYVLYPSVNLVPYLFVFRTLISVHHFEIPSCFGCGVINGRP